MQSASPDFAQLKSNMKASWMAGDFGQIANYAEKGGEEFVARTEIKPDSRILDVACGTGNTAIPAARAGGLVTGVDIAPNLLEQARRRAAVERLSIRFQEGDAEELPYRIVNSTSCSRCSEACLRPDRSGWPRNCFVAPEHGGGKSGRRWHHFRSYFKRFADKPVGSPIRHRDESPGSAHTNQFRGHPLRSRREHGSEHREHDVEFTIRY